MSKQFGAVFRDPEAGGPLFTNIKSPTSLPTWIDWRSPGNTNANQTATEVFKHWDKNTMKRFEIFMERFYQNNTPWKQDWLDRTAPNFKSNETKIVKCKMELIKRLLKIKLIGPESLEDWILLFLYTENQLRIPNNIENLLRPNISRVNTDYYLKTPAPKPDPLEFYVLPARQWISNPANMKLWGFDSGVYDPNNPNNPEAPTFRYNNNTVPTGANGLRTLLQRTFHFPVSTNIQARNRGGVHTTTRMNEI